MRRLLFTMIIGLPGSEAFSGSSTWTNFHSFFNVLAGEMSVIGPRPYMISENEKYQALIPAYVLRHRVKPGMTGLAQSFGFHGSVTDPERMKERIVIDLHYIHHWNFFMDIKIIGRTINMMFKKIH